VKYFGECTDCGKKMQTRAQFSDHFTRDNNFNITGCGPVPPVQKKVAKRVQ
jgi:hypothetical protein